MIEERIPGQVGVFIRLDQPTVFPQSDDAQRNATVFPPVIVAVESAPRPLVTAAVGGVQFRKRVRTLSTGGGTGSGGPLIAVQVEPVWAAVGTLTPALPAAGIVPKGRYDGFIPSMPVDSNGTVPNAGHRPAGELLRFRWVGTPVAAESIGASGAAAYSATLVSPNDIAPGSVVVTAEVGSNALILRDNGKGRVVGQEATGNAYGDGTINYRTGELVLTFSAITTGVPDVLVDYEHSTLYLPVDISLDWDAQLAQG